MEGVKTGEQSAHRVLVEVLDTDGAADLYGFSSLEFDERLFHSFEIFGWKDIINVISAAKLD